MSDVKMLQGDCREVLKTLPDESVHCVITSPPYWGLRDYGTEPQVWTNGSEPCEAHEWTGNTPHLKRGGSTDSLSEKQRSNRQWDMNGDNINLPSGTTCARCGAWSGSLGLEPTPELYVAHLVQIFREVRRVLRDDGTLWLNLGDSYYNYRGENNRRSDKDLSRRVTLERSHHNIDARPNEMQIDGMKGKDLVGIPWMTAFALRTDGWYLRSEIIWAKPNPMPESVRDRPTKSHEQIFLLSKSATYYYDAEAIAEPLLTSSIKRNQRGWHGNEQRDYVSGPQNHMSKYLGSEKAKAETHRNKRSVWTIPTSPYKEAHFATFPPKLIEPMILAGTSARGVCAICGAQWERVVERTQLSERDDTGRTHSLESHRNGKSAPPEKGWESESKTLGWQPTCSHQGEPIPPTILDPFAGSGTVGQVAIKHQRNAILIDLNPIYLTLQEKRTNGVQVAMPIGVV